MNREAILKTAQACYSEEDACYVARSSFSDVICGHGETEVEALVSFRESVEVHWKEYLKS